MRYLLTNFVLVQAVYNYGDNVQYIMTQCRASVNFHDLCSGNKLVGLILPIG